MDRMTKQGIHDLLERVLNANTKGEWAFFRFVRYTNGSPMLNIRLSGIEYLEVRAESELIEVVTRAKDATDE